MHGVPSLRPLPDRYRTPTVKEATEGVLCTILLAPATLLYVKARSEHERRLFTPTEIALFVAIAVAAIVGVVGLWTGRITV